jgi:hypothetical protein
MLKISIRVPVQGRFVYDELGLGECLSLHNVDALHAQDSSGLSLFHPSPLLEPSVDVSPTSVSFSLAHVAPDDRPATMVALYHLMNGHCDKPGQEGGREAGSRLERSGVGRRISIKAFA